VADFELKQRLAVFCSFLVLLKQYLKIYIYLCLSLMSLLMSLCTELLLY